MPILLNNLQTQKALSEAETSRVSRVLDFGLARFDKSAAETSLILVNDAYIRELNREYRGLDQPTDVLSFAMQEGDDGPPIPVSAELPELLGDIYISVERALEQAESYGHSFERELCYLAVHGLLHLLGFDHQGPEDTGAMREEEEAIMKEFALERGGFL
jgi:probable rRNA maturation factor